MYEMMYDMMYNMMMMMMSCTTYDKMYDMMMVYKMMMMSCMMYDMIYDMMYDVCDILMMIPTLCECNKTLFSHLKTLIKTLIFSSSKSGF